MGLNEEKERKQIWIIRWQSGKIRSEYGTYQEAKQVAEEIGESTSSYEFPKEKTASVCRRITADPGSSIGNLCDHADGNRILMDRDDPYDSRIRTYL